MIVSDVRLRISIFAVIIIGLLLGWAVTIWHVHGIRHEIRAYLRGLHLAHVPDQRDGDDEPPRPWTPRIMKGGAAALALIAAGLLAAMLVNTPGTQRRGGGSGVQAEEPSTTTVKQPVDTTTVVVVGGKPTVVTMPAPTGDGVVEAPVEAALLRGGGETRTVVRTTPGPGTTRTITKQKPPPITRPRTPAPTVQPLVCATVIVVNTCLG